MKTRESGMPAEEMWQTFFTPTETLHALGLRRETANVVDFGCGYGTFTIPAAQLIGGTVHAFDIEPEMIEETKRKAERTELTNIKLYLRDFVADGTGLPDTSVDCVMLYNILHAEDPARLLSESFRILRGGGTVGIMHWNYDPKTPRGPSIGQQGTDPLNARMFKADVPARSAFGTRPLHQLFGWLSAGFACYHPSESW